jgi:hypothetical protein
MNKNTALIVAKNLDRNLIQAMFGEEKRSLGDGTREVGRRRLQGLAG